MMFLELAAICFILWLVFRSAEKKQQAAKDPASAPKSDFPELIIHDACGLPVELCTCFDAPVKYDSDLDRFIDESDYMGE